MVPWRSVPYLIIVLFYSKGGMIPLEEIDYLLKRMKMVAHGKNVKLLYFHAFLVDYMMSVKVHVECI